MFSLFKNMSFKCFICSNVFSVKCNLERHLNQKRCKSPLLTDLVKLNEKIKPLNNQIQEIQTKMSFKCLICSNYFSVKRNLERHLNEKRCKSHLLTDLIKLNEKIKLLLNNQIQPEIQQEIQPEIQKEIQPEIQPEIQKEIQPKIQPEIQQEIQPEIQPENQLKFDGIFQGREKEIRITPDKRVSVFDLIKVVSGQKNPRETWKNILKNHQDEVVQFLDNLKFEGSGQKLTPVINVQGMVKLLFLLPGETAKQFRSKSAETMIRYLGGDLTLILLFKKQIEDVEQIELNNQIQEIQPENQLKFDGIFQGREKEIRITSDKQISVFDFIKVVGGQTNPKDTWSDIKKKYKNEVVGKSDYFKFCGKGQRLTPVINVQGMVKLLFWLPGEMAKQFRSKSAETMIRYLGGDLTLVDEIKMIDKEHTNNPNNIAQIFREEVIENQPVNLCFNQDQINTSKKLINYYGNKKDIFYAFLFWYNNELFSKYGMAGEVREFYKRIEEHVLEFEEICFYNVLQCNNVDKVESEFKQTALVNMNKVKIPKKNGGNHTEIIKLSEIVTTNVIKEEMYKVAGDRMLDPPPRYSVEESCNGNSLEIEKELTKQKEIECKELTRQKELDFEMKKLDFEMKKMEFEMMKIQHLRI